MEINREIAEVLKECKVPVKAGTLVLLGIYFNLDVDRVCQEEIVKAVSTTKIVEMDYNNGVIKWNIPLFKGQETTWAWVEHYNESFGRINPTRKDNLADVTKRMIEFFKLYPQFRMQDVKKATKAYLDTIKDPQYLKRSAKFIFEGQGATKISLLLNWCEKVTDKFNDNGRRGKIIS